VTEQLFCNNPRKVTGTETIKTKHYMFGNRMPPKAAIAYDLPVDSATDPKIHEPPKAANRQRPKTQL
jgi:hypothetical protein